MIGVDASMTNSDQFQSEMSVGELARRAGVSVSTLHFYEAKGLLASRRTEGNQRRYPMAFVRLVAVIRIAQRAGISLSEIRETLSNLPVGRAPSESDWSKMSSEWRDRLQEKITALYQLRDQLQNCIGCGCLSLKNCPLHNPDDELGKTGTGAVLLQNKDRVPSCYS